MSLCRASVWATLGRMPARSRLVMKRCRHYIFRQPDGKSYRCHTGQRVRKALAKLRQALRENGADTHLLIVRGGDARTPEYTMVLRFGEA
jgi:hypothetical protein